VKSQDYDYKSTTTLGVVQGDDIYTQTRAYMISRAKTFGRNQTMAKS